MTLPTDVSFREPQRESGPGQLLSLVSGSYAAGQLFFIGHAVERDARLNASRSADRSGSPAT